MSNLLISPVFEEITSAVGADPVSAIYFGWHCGRNIVIIQHKVTLMVVFRSDDHDNPDFIKSVSSKGIDIKGTKIVGNGDVVLLLDDGGSLWRLVNAFDSSNGKDQRFHLLDKKCYYEWVPFRKLNFKKVLAVSAWGCGFACLGICGNSEKKLVLLPSTDSHLLEDYTFQELTSSSSLQFCLTNVRNPKDSTNHFPPLADTLLVTDMFTGKTYQCSQDGTHSLLNYSNSLFISLLHFQQENCLLLAFHTGKLVFHFFNNSPIHHVTYLPYNISLMEKCSCSASCLLWSNGLFLHHTKLLFQHQHPHIKLSHLKLNSNIQNPSHFAKLEEHILVATLNNIYYVIRPSHHAAKHVHKTAQDLLLEMYNGSLRVHQLNTKMEVMSQFVQCKELVERKEKVVEMSLEEKWLVIKLCVDVVLKREIWKVRLMVCCGGKRCVKMEGLEMDVSEGMLVRVENPFGSENKVRVSLVGDLDGESILLYLGEVGGGGGRESGKREQNELRKCLNEILSRRESVV